MLSAAKQFAAAGPQNLRRIVFVLFGREAFSAFDQAAAGLLT